MITRALLEQNFYPVVAMGDVVRCGDELPDRVIHTSFLLPRTPEDGVPFIVSDDLVDDAFVAQMLAEAGRAPVTALTKRAIGANAYSFSHILLVPPDFHGELRGRMDEERRSSVLVVPIFEPEFSGTEDAEEFATLRRLVPTQRWDRTVQPRIALRFDNPRTGSGTGDDYVLVSFHTLEAERENLASASGGFLEVVNFRGQVIELVPQGDGTFSLIRNRDDAGAFGVTSAEASDWLWASVLGDA